MTVYQIRMAASMWLNGKDTKHIADYLRIDERKVWKHLDRIRAEVALMKARAA